LNKTYLHPLDYVIGAKHYLTSEKLDVEYTVSPDNFYVEEIIDLNTLGFNNEKGEYTVYLLEKRNIDTLTAVRLIAKEMNIPFENLVVLGFKDRASTSRQYVFVKTTLVSDIDEITGRSFKVKRLGFTRRKPRKGELQGNRFKILIGDDRESTLHRLKQLMNQIIQHGLPSYYGYQRFGVSRFNTHLLGKYIVTGRFDLFVDEMLHGIYPLENPLNILLRINNIFPKTMYYENVVYRYKPYIPQRFIRDLARDIYVDAYNSYLYNLLLNNIVESKGWSSLDDLYPTIGCVEYFDEYYGEIAKRELISINRINLFKCWFRNGLFKPKSIEIKHSDGSIILEFTLDKGFYASILLRELFKDNLYFTSKYQADVSLHDL